MPTRSAEEVYDKIEEFHQEARRALGARPLLKRLALEGKTFASLDEAN